MIEIVWICLAVLVICFGFVVVRGAPYVPSHRSQLERAFGELYEVGQKDTIIDLGSGDGVVLEVVARRGAHAIGYELNPFLVLISRLRLRKYKNVRVSMKDYLVLDSLPLETTVVYAFSTGHNINHIGSKMQQWASVRKLYFISYGFMLADKKPIKTVGAMNLYIFEPKKA